MGIEEPEDKTTVAAEAKPGDVISTELKKINEAVAKKPSASADATSLPPDFAFWGLDDKNKIKDPPTEALLDQISKLNKKEVAYKAAEDSSGMRTRSRSRP